MKYTHEKKNAYTNLKFSNMHTKAKTTIKNCTNSWQNTTLKTASTVWLFPIIGFLIQYWDIFPKFT